MGNLKPFAFVLMPFSSDFDDVYKLGIQAAANETDVVAERVDEQKFSETMLERIYRQINAADFIIADMSGRNPNVFYEVGYAHAKDKLCTLLTERADDIPFDLKHHRHIVYGNSINSLKDKLIPEFQWLKDQNAKRKSSNIIIELRSESADLIKEGEWFDKGKLELTLDLHNPSDQRTPEIEALYLFTTKHWQFLQNGSPCAHREVDKESPRRQHFLNSPVRRLSPGAWAQIQIVGERNLWSKYGPHSSERKKSYRIAGHVVVELVTSEGNFREKLNLDVTFDDLPF